MFSTLDRLKRGIRTAGRSRRATKPLTGRPRLASLIEAHVCAGRTAATLIPLLPAKVEKFAPPLAFAVGRLAEEAEEFSRARELFERAAVSADPQLRRRATAHLAHLDYYAGAFSIGLERASLAVPGATGIARVETELYASVNAIALNRSALALDCATAAANGLRRVADQAIRTDARFRVGRQLVHVLVARGDYVGAWNEAEGARRSALHVQSERHLALAQYLCGYVALARGNRGCLAHFQESARANSEDGHAFGRWLDYVWASALRDFGDSARACVFWRRSTLSVPWEDPLFILACGNEAPFVALEGSSDERPFRSAMRGVQQILANDSPSAIALLESAAEEFERCGLEHYRRGAALALAAALLRAGHHGRAVGILRVETPGLAKSQAQRWAWSHSVLTRELAAAALAVHLEPSYWRSLARPRAKGATVEDVMRARGLTEREISVTLAWLAQPKLGRAAFARGQRLAESSVRNHINAVRRKLGCGIARGPVTVERRLAELTRSIELQ